MTSVERYPKGTKVEVVVGYDDKDIWTLGEGSYQGVESPPWFGGNTAEKIVLINGDVIYDCECIWGTTGSFRKMFDTRTVHRAKVIRDKAGIYRGYEADESVPVTPPVAVEIVTKAKLPEVLEAVKAVHDEIAASKTITKESIKDALLSKLNMLRSK